MSVDRVTRLSDLLAAEPPVYTVAPEALRWHVEAGDDPVLCRVDFDVLPPRALPSGMPGCWVADRTTYAPGLLPAGAELVRSVGEWSPPGRLALSQCLTGEVVLLTALPDDPPGTLTAQWCRVGDLAAVPPGAWHMTAVISGPAEVLSVRTAIAGEASTDRPPVRITAVADLVGFNLTGPDLSPDRPVPIVGTPAVLRAVVPPTGLAALHWSGHDEQHAELLHVFGARAGG
jgi:hypothetical protein